MAVWGQFNWGQTGQQAGTGTYVGPTVANILYQAQRMANVLRRPGWKGAPEDDSDGLMRLNAIVDQWAARKAYAFSETFQKFTLTPNHAPHLIGPGLTSPDFNFPIRPMRLEENGAALILTNVTPNVDVPMTVRDADWWNNQRVKALSTSVPTDVYYEPDFPNGALNFWPVPNFAYGVRLRLWTVVTQFSNTTAQLIAPPAYLDALIKTLAEQLVLMYPGTMMPPSLPMEAIRARAALQMNNSKSPSIPSADYGTRGNRERGDFNYYSGGPSR